MKMHYEKDSSSVFVYLLVCPLNQIVFAELKVLLGILWWVGSYIDWWFPRAGTHVRPKLPHYRVLTSYLFIEHIFKLIFPKRLSEWFIFFSLAYVRSIYNLHTWKTFKCGHTILRMLSLLITSNSDRFLAFWYLLLWRTRLF